MGFLPALTLIFIMAQLFGVIDWSLLAILSPLLFAGFIWLVCFAIIGFASKK